MSVAIMIFGLDVLEYRLCTTMSRFEMVQFLLPLTVEFINYSYKQGLCLQFGLEFPWWGAVDSVHDYTVAEFDYLENVLHIAG